MTESRQSIRQTLSADVYSQLRDLLISGRVMPGEKLSLRSIADALGVSVMPVREAVHRLVAEQTLEMAANRYIRGPVLTVSQFREITSIRLNLEGQAIARAAQLMSALASDRAYAQFRFALRYRVGDSSDADQSPYGVGTGLEGERSCGGV